MQIPLPQGLLKSIFHAQDGILPPIMAPLQKIGFAACSGFFTSICFLQLSHKGLYYQEKTKTPWTGETHPWRLKSQYSNLVRECHWRRH